MALPGIDRKHVAAAFLAFILIFGGGGSPAPLAELACEIAALAALTVSLLLPKGATQQPNRSFGWICALVVGIVLVQLVPLPPALWHRLPGRDVEIEALNLIGQADRWQTWSIAPHRTLAALLSLGPPLLALWFATQLDRSGLRLLVWVIVSVAILSVAVGALQLAQQGAGPFDFYGGKDVGILHGFQANRNATADVLLIGLLALALNWRESPRVRRNRLILGNTFVGGLLVLALFLTGSRAGIALLPVAALFAWRIAESERKLGSGIASGGRIGVLVAPLVLAIGGLWWFRESPTVSRILARFDSAGDFRFELWRDTWTAALQYWPIGSGVGTFVPAFYPAERLEVVDATLANRAHNEALEALLEGGIPLAVCWLLVFAIVLRSGVAAWRNADSRGRRWLAFAAGTIMIVALHSLVDYPLRSMALAALAATAAGITLSAAALGIGTGRNMLDGAG